jgi:hypothetical protein
MEAKTCCARVKLEGRWNYGTCSKVAIKDGFCKIHHPDYIKAKNDAINARREAEYSAHKQARLEAEAKQAALESIAAKAPARIKALEDMVEMLDHLLSADGGFYASGVVHNDVVKLLEKRGI